MIDPCKMPQVENDLVKKSLTIDMALLTHEHYDHISGINWLQESNIPIIANDACAKNIQDVRMNHSKFYQAFCAVQEHLRDDPIPNVKARRFHADKVFSGDQLMEWQGHTLLLFPTPGHSQGSICILFDDHILFAGDSLLRDKGAEFKILGGSMDQYESETLPRLRRLSPDVIVYPGHGSAFTLGEHYAIKAMVPTAKAR